METTKLVDRVVVEFKGPQGHTLANEFIANKLREIADAIEDGRSGDDFTEDIGAEFEVLWEHESVSYGGFRMGDKSLIGMHYYGSEKKDEFPVITLMREDLEQKGFDTSNLGDEWMEKIASKVGDILLDSDYWDHLVWAAEYYKVPLLEEDEP